MKLIGRVGEKSLGEIEEYLESLDWEKSLYYGNWDKKYCLWFGKKVFLGTNEIVEGLVMDSRLEKFCRKYYSDFNCSLVYKYINCGINKHRDRDCFDNKVVIINFHECKFGYVNKVFEMKKGEIWEFDSKKFHWVEEVKYRVSLQLRKVVTGNCSKGMV